MQCQFAQHCLISAQPCHEAEECLFALLQELGGCGLGSKCFWAHGTAEECLFALLQELGGCGLGSKCFWAHGTNDLDTKDFSFDFPLVNANRQPGEWDRVGRKSLVVKTGKGKQAAWQGPSTSAWGPPQHHSHRSVFSFRTLLVPSYCAVHDLDTVPKA